MDTSEPEVMHSDLVLEAETQDFHDDMELLLHCGIVGTVVSLHDIIVLLQNMVFHFSPHCWALYDFNLKNEKQMLTGVEKWLL